MCPVSSDGDMKKKEQGTYVERTAAIDSVTLSVVSWYDNKVVTLYRTLLEGRPQLKLQDFQKKRNNISRFHVQNLLLYITNPLGSVDILGSCKWSLPHQN